MIKFIELLLRSLLGRELDNPSPVIAQEPREPVKAYPEQKLPPRDLGGANQRQQRIITPVRKDIPVMNKSKPRTSLRGCCEIIAKEAVILNRYLDTEGIWTIGPGVTAAAGADINPNTFKGRITLERSIDLFQKILPKYERIVYNLMGGAAKAAKLKPHEFDALVSLAYNAGDINKPMTRKLARSGDIAGAIDIWRANRVLWSRRDKEVALAKYGVYSAKTIPVGLADPNGLVLKSTFKYMKISKLIERLEDAGGFA